jgi:hypothetical protein
MPTDKMSFEELKTEVNFGRPHVVILGAGASVAALPGGDANGIRLPVMLNFVETLGIEGILSDAAVKWKDRNFEDIFQELTEDPSLVIARQKVEDAVSGYFGSMTLPAQLTIYDYLVLSLRQKDVVATFNWDPFLFSACLRNRTVAPMPQILFLHGCAVIGYCEEHSQQGLLSARCRICNRQFTPTKLLYPIKNKNYDSDAYISSQWRTLHKALENAFILTVFGYGAPASDAAAIKLMSDAWGLASERNLEETEIIDIKSEKELADNWKPFIHSHHYRATKDYLHSLLGRFPRRTCEAIWAETQEIKFLDYVNPFPDFHNSLPELQNWIKSSLLIFE